MTYERKQAIHSSSKMHTLKTVQQSELTVFVFGCREPSQSGSVHTETSQWVTKEHSVHIQYNRAQWVTQELLSGSQGSAV